MEAPTLRLWKRLVLLSTLVCLLSTIAFIFSPFVQNGGYKSSSFTRRNVGATMDRYYSLDTQQSGLSTPNTTSHLIDRRQTSNNHPANDPYSCGPGNPCSNGACCGVTGVCGYGPTYCGSGCSSNCKATAPCGQYSDTGSVTCPLKVCCSQWGFCGTTSDFCGTGCQSNCLTPSSPGSGGDVRSTVIGYYESWKSPGVNRTCGTMEPSQIPVEGLTHLNFAFAYIVPGSYDIVVMPGVGTNLLQQVTDQKKANPDLKVYVSIGGWSFNDNNTVTQPVFSDIASTLPKRAAFASKLTQFMVQYGFDGVDLDWEYPGAPDRGGQAVDVKNYPLLLQIIQAKFRIEQKSWGITITVPTSYWYLRWFDLQEIAKYVTYLNLMSYDLHGIWDSTDPIGPYVYGHTNLTEIDLALQLFWRNNISPSIINLGLAFYGRTFELSDPSCTKPGCGFNGPGPKGPCTDTPGILSYREIQDILTKNGSYQQFYDADASVNYLVYDEIGWVSYDDKTTFQQKIDFANKRGLNGLLIWAIDQDDDSFTALKAVTGKDLAPTVAESDTLGQWSSSSCWVTPCGTDCQEGWVKMTGLNLANGQGCKGGGKNSKQRSLCCPPWGAPDPKTCNWHGTGPQCYGQCLPGEMLMAVDNYGGASHCDHGVKAFCCPATGAEAAIAACHMVYDRKCPANLPQQIGTIGTDANGWLAYCCPAAPVWNNCAWHGNSVTCDNNRCPSNQVEMATSKGGDGGFFSGCVLGRQKAFCCDPPFNGSSAILPVALDFLFPETLPAADAPIYYEAFDHSKNENPSFDPVFTEDPNKEPFAWVIMVGSEKDVQSLRRRDGSHLETFDCPTPDKSDYGVQRLKAVCMVESDDNNCEDIMLGSVHGTIVRLPEECGPDDYVRVISFQQIEDFSLPSKLVKRVPEKHKVYEIRYDYNFRQLRRDGGEVYVRFDASDHPGYWDEIVASSPTGPVKARSLEEHPEGWREFHMAWFEHKISKRGFGTSDSWWLSRFNALLSRGPRYGLSKKYTYDQIIYKAEKNCAPSATASIEATVHGELGATLDFGMSLIGTLRNFDFTESYAYFNLYNLSVSSQLALTGHARIKYQSTKVPLLENWDPFGGSFNLKGIFTVGPYFDATAQIEAVATLSGQITGGMSIGTTGQFTYMFPQSMNVFPVAAQIQPFPLRSAVTSGTSASISSDGSVTLTVVPSVGFQISLDAFGQPLVNTKVSASFSNAMVLQIGANTADCSGAHYGIDWSLGVSIDLQNPLPGWASGAQTIPIYGRTAYLRPMTCYPWSATNPNATRRSLDWGTATRVEPLTIDAPVKSLSKRADNNNVLFPDIFGSAIICPNGINTPTGNCAVKISDYGNDPTDGGAIGRRDLANIRAGNDSLPLEKRARKPGFTFCAGAAIIPVLGPTYPSSGDMIRDAATNPFLTYGPSNPGNCDDYSFGQVGTPPATDSANWASEHILEWQLYQDFLHDYVAMNPFTAPNPVALPSSNQFPKAGTYNICQYMRFWWGGRRMTVNGVVGWPVDLVAYAFPTTATNRAEFMLLEKDTNNLKERLWGTGDMRRDTTMTDYINAVEQDVNSAINVCKAVMNAVKYQQDARVSNILVTQATRIGQWFDDVENVLAAFNDPNFNSLPYTRLNIGAAWRSWIKNQHTLANAKQIAFLDFWVPAINEAHMAPGAGGDTAMGGTEENENIITRIAHLTDAKDAMTAWTNPFPANW